MNRKPFFSVKPSGAAGKKQTKEPTAPDIRFNTEGIPTLSLGDFHGGAVINPEDTQNLNMYSLEIMEGRIRSVFQQFVEFCRKESPDAPFDSCVVVLTGDLVETDYFHRMEISSVKCTRLVANLLFEQLQSLSRNEGFSNILVCAIPGNHGRMARPREGDQDQNFDAMCIEALKDRCELLPELNIEVHTCSSGQVAWEVFGIPYVLVHGNEFAQEKPKKAGSLARYDRESVRTAARIHRANLVDTLKSWHAGQIKTPDALVLVFGHFHKSVVDPCAGLMGTGALRGITQGELAAGKFALEAPKASAWITTTQGITACAELHADREEVSLRENEDANPTPIKVITWKVDNPAWAQHLQEAEPRRMR
jgi:hypothetical protein